MLVMYTQEHEILGAVTTIVFLESPDLWQRILTEVEKGSTNIMTHDCDWIHAIILPQSTNKISLDKP